MANVTDMTDEQLEKRAADLAKQRTSVRLEQNEVQAEIDLRHALSSLNEESRRVVQVRLGGSIASKGETNR